MNLLFNTIALKNVNVTDVTKSWFALISASGTCFKAETWFLSALNAVSLLPKLV